MFTYRVPYFGVLESYVEYSISLPFLWILNPIQTEGLWRPYQTLKLNNFKALKAMTTKFTDFS